MTFVELSADSAWLDDLCTLPTSQRPGRLSAFDELFRTAVIGHRRTSPTVLELELTSDPTIVGKAATLLADEARCCTFFAFTVAITADAVRLVVEVPTAQIEVLDALVERVSARQE